MSNRRILAIAHQRLLLDMSHPRSQFVYESDVGLAAKWFLAVPVLERMSSSRSSDPGSNIPTMSKGFHRYVLLFPKLLRLFRIPPYLMMVSKFRNFSGPLMMSAHSEAMRMRSHRLWNVKDGSLLASGGHTIGHN